MHSYTHKRNEAKIKEAEAELEALLKGDVAEEASDETPEEEPNGEGSEATEVSDAGDTKQEEAKEETKASEDDAELSGEEKSFKKRYGDIQRHMAETQKKQAAQIKRLEDQLEKAAKNELVLPKSKEEIDAWTSKYPDVAGIVEAIAEKKANERASDLDSRLQEIEELRSTAKREKAEAQLVSLHPDFEAIEQMMRFMLGQILNLKFIRMLYTKTLRTLSLQLVSQTCISQTKVLRLRSPAQIKAQHLQSKLVDVLQQTQKSLAKR